VICFGRIHMHDLKCVLFATSVGAAPVIKVCSMCSSRAEQLLDDWPLLEALINQL
jgi:hypothetical protein